MKVVVLRWGHRPERDKRVSTHVCLVARAFGADEVIVSGIRDKELEENVKKIVDSWGGPFEVVSGLSWREVVEGWKREGGEVVHLTMYGTPIQSAIDAIRSSKKDKLVLVGAEKVPGEFYGLADYNIAVTGQPHSEVAALAIFLDRLFEGRELSRKFAGAKIRISPSDRSKRLER